MKPQLSTGWNVHYFGTFSKCILKTYFYCSLYQFVQSGWFHSRSSLNKIMTWCRTDAKPLHKLITMATDNVANQHLVVSVESLLRFFSFQVVEVGLQGGDHRVTRVVKSLLALPMLPAREIPDVFHAIWDYVIHQRHRGLLDLCRYFIGLWLKDSQGQAKWAPNKWSVYG